MAEMLKVAANSDKTPQRESRALGRNGEKKERRRAPLAARIGMAGLADIRDGRLTVNLPDGRTHAFGASFGPQAEITVHRWRFFSRLLRGSDIGAGESYVDGDWTTPDLVALTRLFLINEESLDAPRWVGFVGRLRDRLLHISRTNTRSRAKRNIHEHYDLSNDFYRLFLDPSMTYSAGIFDRPGIGLEASQRAKYRRLADWAGLREGDHVLEIGCGWGGFAEYAARELGCRVTGLTLSVEQARFARQRIGEKGFDHMVDIRVKDYRDVEGSFDAIVSIEMLEAVGHRFLDGYFAACERLLKPGGRMALQTITINDQEYDGYRRGMDWIRKYIFPGGHLPSVGAIQNSLKDQTGFVINRLENIGEHYATTLQHWRRRFWLKIDEVRGLGFDDAFIRMWDFYLATCEAAFLHRKIGDVQMQLVRAGEVAEDREGSR